MIKLFLLLIILVIAFFAVHKFINTSSEILSEWIKKIAFALFVVLIVFLAATGRLNHIFALVGILVAFVLRILPTVLRNAPQLQQLWQAFNKKTQSSGANSSGALSGEMSKKEAYDVLGLSPSASRKEIIMAHRKLIQKMHPDRGGSDYLAVKINLAKKVLIENK